MSLSTTVSNGEDYFSNLPPEILLTIVDFSQFTNNVIENGKTALKLRFVCKRFNEVVKISQAVKKARNYIALKAEKKALLIELRALNGTPLNQRDGNSWYTGMIYKAWWKFKHAEGNDFSFGRLRDYKVNNIFLFFYGGKYLLCPLQTKVIAQIKREACCEATGVDRAKKKYECLVKRFKEIVTFSKTDFENGVIYIPKLDESGNKNQLVGGRLKEVKSAIQRLEESVADKPAPPSFVKKVFQAFTQNLPK